MKTERFLNYLKSEAARAIDPISQWLKSFENAIVEEGKLTAYDIYTNLKNSEAVKEYLINKRRGCVIYSSLPDKEVNELRNKNS